MKTYTIGFTKKSAERFFQFLKASEVKTLIDVRLNNVSQLAGFAKRDDLKFFLREICNANYVHLPELSPTKELLDAYKKDNMPWQKYEDAFIDLMVNRNIEKHVPEQLMKDGCLLCSEDKPHYCHRRVVVEYLNRCWDKELEIKHLF